jgi:hypothetical protein
MHSPLHLGVLVLGAWALVALAVQIAGARGYGRIVYHATAAADPHKGVIYAFGAGMMPSAKESVREHLPSYFAGIGYHIGIAAALAVLGLSLAGVRFNEAPMAIMGLRTLCLIGTACGIVLFVKRIAQPDMRRLSHPDDFIANALASLFVAASFAATIYTGARPLQFVAAMLLFFYAPLGKIRHCAFFFVSRYHLGFFFGRRGVYPPHA